MSLDFAGFSPVNLFHVSLILRAERRAWKGRGNVFLLNSGPMFCSSILFFFFLINFFIFFIFGCVGSSSLLGAGFSLRWLLLLQSTGSVVVARGLSSCGSRAQ